MLLKIATEDFAAIKILAIYFYFHIFSSFCLEEGVGENHIRFEIRETRRIFLVKDYYYVFGNAKMFILFRSVNGKTGCVLGKLGCFLTSVGKGKGIFPRAVVPTL